MIVLAYVGFYLVFRENTYGAATIQVAEGQRVIATGPYAVVRHPMYGWALLMMLGIPLALGSWWGLVIIAPAIAGIVARLLDEDNSWPGTFRVIRITCARSRIGWCLMCGEAVLPTLGCGSNLPSAR